MCSTTTLFAHVHVVVHHDSGSVEVTVTGAGPDRQLSLLVCHEVGQADAWSTAGADVVGALEELAARSAFCDH